MKVAELIAELGKLDPDMEVGERDEHGRFFPIQQLRVDEDAVLIECWVVTA